MLSNRSLLTSGVQGLLHEMEEIDLHVVMANGPDVAGTLRGLEPRVIVLDSSDLSIGDGAIVHVLRDCPEAKVIAVNLDPAAIDVYEVRHILQTSLEGLLQAIRETSRPVR